MKNQNKQRIALSLTVMGILFSVTMAFAQMKMPSDGSKMVMSAYSFSETLELLKGAIESQNLMVIHEVDAQKMLRMAGKEVKGMRQIFFFHPNYMRKVMEANSEAVIQIPLKMIVMESPDGKAMVRYWAPSTALKSYSGTEAIAKELDGLVEKITGELKK